MEESLVRSANRWSFNRFSRQVETMEQSRYCFFCIGVCTVKFVWNRRIAFALPRREESLSQLVLKFELLFRGRGFESTAWETRSPISSRLLKVYTTRVYLSLRFHFHAFLIIYDLTLASGTTFKKTLYIPLALDLSFVGQSRYRWTCIERNYIARNTIITPVLRR